jgi:hypothetical protein
LPALVAAVARAISISPFLPSKKVTIAVSREQ